MTGPAAPPTLTSAFERMAPPASPCATLSVSTDPHAASDWSCTTASMSPWETVTGGDRVMTLRPTVALNGPRSATTVKKARELFERTKTSLNAFEHDLLPHWTTARLTVPLALAGCDRSMKVRGKFDAPMLSCDAAYGGSWPTVTGCAAIETAKRRTAAAARTTGMRP